MVLLSSTCCLKELSLAGNALGDAGIEALSVGLGRSTSFGRLNLANNNMGNQGAYCMSMVLSMNLNLYEVDLSWNQIKSKGAIDIANSLRGNETLLGLDLSWNVIGRGMGGVSYGAHASQEVLPGGAGGASGGSLQGGSGLGGDAMGSSTGGGARGARYTAAGAIVTGMDAAIALGEMLACNRYLLHLSLDNNYMQADELQAFGVRLQSNQTLLGLHIDGNCGKLDALGYAYVSSTFNDLSHQHVTRGSRDHNARWLDLPSILSRVAPSANLAASSSNCWICQGWNEVHFQWIPGESSADSNVEKVYLHLSIDRYVEVFGGLWCRGIEASRRHRGGTSVLRLF